jgi:DNA-binding GntR family transcriptional regulator
VIPGPGRVADAADEPARAHRGSPRGAAPGAAPPGRGDTAVSQAALDRLTPVRAQTTSGIIADRLRRQIVTGAFAPGSQMVEPKLAERLGVSRGPVREALQRLVQEGLLVTIPHRGVFVVELGAGDVADIYAARRAIEREAAVRLHATHDEAHLARLTAVVDDMGSLADLDGLDRMSLIAEKDLAFHSALVDAADSPRLTRMFATLAAETRMCLSTLMHHYPRRAALVEEHRQLLVLLRGDDELALLRAVDAHLESAVHDLTRSA